MGKKTNPKEELRKKMIWIKGIRFGLEIRDIARIMGYSGSGYRKWIRRNGLRGKEVAIVDHRRAQVMLELIVCRGDVALVVKTLNLPATIVADDIKVVQAMPIEERSAKFKGAFDARVQQIRERYEGGVNRD
jgi:hypothetical protein